MTMTLTDWIITYAVVTPFIMFFGGLFYFIVFDKELPLLSSFSNWKEMVNERQGLNSDDYLYKSVVTREHDYAVLFVKSWLKLFAVMFWPLILPVGILYLVVKVILLVRFIGPMFRSIKGVTE